MFYLFTIQYTETIAKDGCHIRPINAGGKPVTANYNGLRFLWVDYVDVGFTPVKFKGQVTVY